MNVRESGWTVSSLFRYVVLNGLPSATCCSLPSMTANHLSSPGVAGYVRVLLVQPRPPILDDPLLLGLQRRVAGPDHAAPLAGYGRPVPGVDPPVDGLLVLGQLVVELGVMWSAL